MFPRLWHHFPSGLENKLAVDELLNARDGEGHFWVYDAEILIQADAHGLKARNNLLNAHPSLLHSELEKKTWTTHYSSYPVWVQAKVKLATVCTSTNT